MSDLKPISDMKSERLFEVSVTDSDGEEKLWDARRLKKIFEYSRWEDFEKVIKKAIISCRNSNDDENYHFRYAPQTIITGKGAERSRKNYQLTRHACYLVAQNGDPRKETIAYAMRYFAVQTRKQEIRQFQDGVTERISARQKLSETESKMSRVLMSEGNLNGRGLGIVRSEGDKALFGGNNTAAMRKKLGIKGSKPIADRLPTVTLKAKDLAAEMTTHKTREKRVRGVNPIKNLHINHNKDVRQALKSAGIIPEELPAEEDIKKLERKINKNDHIALEPAEKPLQIEGSFDDVMEKIAKVKSLKK